MSLGGTDLNLLTALKALLEEVNVTHAGSRVNMSQPAMSGALARLRRHFDDELLVRDGRDYELTPLARELLPQVQEAVRLAHEALHVDEDFDFDPATCTRSFRFMLSDFALSVVHPLLRNRMRAAAPGIRLEFLDLADDIRLSDRALVDNDILIGPLGYDFPGDSELLFRDRMVCVVDRANPRLRNGRLSLADFEELPHVVARFGRSNFTPVDRALGELGINRHTKVSVVGWLALPLAVAGTDMVAVVPQRLAHRMARSGRLAVVEPPFGEVELIEGFWWLPTKAAESGHAWLLSVLRDVAAELAENPVSAAG
ncbi:MAG TPA: LysR family transcriptional regulator [Pseudonocardiaceae bacterium]|jgi:DNA-binding transcriptional LysR family regulator|nr:LysR family transcriptional regulator [Pseudonocardiaceae bacterium]